MDKPVMVSDLEYLPEVMSQAQNVVTARHVSLADFLRLFEPSVHEAIKAACLKPGITHVVCFENLDLWSSNLGHRTALVVGERPKGAEIPTWDLPGVLGKPHFRLGDLPSRFQYPVAYASVDSLRAPVEEGLDVRKYGG